MRELRGSGRYRSLRAPAAAGALLAILRARPVLISLVAAVVILVVTGLSAYWATGAIVVLALSYSCGANAALRRGSFAVAALMVAMQVGMGFSEFPNVEIAFVTVIPFWVGRQVGLRTALARDLAERTRQLQDEHDAFARLSVRRERARIARELHDIVAHHMAVIVVQAGAGRLASRPTTEQTSKRLSTIRESGAQALAEMSRLVDILKAADPSEHELGVRWRLLVDEARAGGLEVGITWLPADARLPEPVAEKAYRIVREGLTNAIKHAPGAQVAVRLELCGEHLQVDVHDGGSTDSARLIDTGAGLGLVGMRERVESGGGTLEAGPDRDGGWRLRAMLPFAAAAVPTKR